MKQVPFIKFVFCLLSIVCQSANDTVASNVPLNDAASQDGQGKTKNAAAAKKSKPASANSRNAMRCVVLLLDGNDFIVEIPVRFTNVLLKYFLLPVLLVTYI